MDLDFLCKFSAVDNQVTTQQKRQNWDCQASTKWLTQSKFLIDLKYYVKVHHKVWISTLKIIIRWYNHDFNGVKHADKKRHPPEASITMQSNGISLTVRKIYQYVTLYWLPCEYQNMEIYFSGKMLNIIVISHSNSTSNYISLQW